MSGEVRTDDRGRVTIPKEVRERYGDRFRRLVFWACRTLALFPFAMRVVRRCPDRRRRAT